MASPVLKTYWHLACERQRIYFRRLTREAPPWSQDPVLQKYRFTNAFRAADQVSQNLIRVIYEGSQKPEDLVFRTLLFRFFNKPSTWRSLESMTGGVTWRKFDLETYSDLLDRMLAQGERIYSAAYIVPPPPMGAVRKHRNHLLLIQHMMKSKIVPNIEKSKSLGGVYEVLRAYPSLGPFLSYQLTVDMNYSTLIDFDENDFTVAGPGARSGIAKCFLDTGGLSDEDIIRWMTESQNEQVENFAFNLLTLFGRDLKLIDCQNLFCETDKYARVAHPDVNGVGNRTRIKQQFNPISSPERPFFPPKWKINQFTLDQEPPREVAHPEEQSTKRISA